MLAIVAIGISCFALGWSLCETTHNIMRRKG